MQSWWNRKIGNFARIRPLRINRRHTQKSADAIQENRWHSFKSADYADSTDPLDKNFLTGLTGFPRYSIRKAWEIAQKWLEQATTDRNKLACFYLWSFSSALMWVIKASPHSIAGSFWAIIHPLLIYPCNPCVSQRETRVKKISRDPAQRGLQWSSLPILNIL